jgi:hypothetical protein
VCARYVAVLERAESRRANGPLLILPLEDRHTRIMRYSIRRWADAEGNEFMSFLIGDLDGRWPSV